MTLFERYKFPPVLDDSKDAKALQLLDHRLLERVIQHPSLVPQCVKIIPKDLRVLHRQVFTNTFCYVWDTFYLFELLNRVIRDKERFGEEEKRRRDEKKESKDDVEEDLKIAIEGGEVFEPEDIERLRERIEKLTRAIVKSNQDIKKNNDLLGRLKDEEKDWKTNENHYQDRIILAFEILNLWKGWQSIRDAYLHLHTHEYIALRYLPLNILTSVEIKANGRVVPSDSNEEHWDKDDTIPNVRITKKLQSASWRYTGYHRNGPNLFEENTDYFLAYPIWNFGSLGLCVCRETGCTRREEE